MSAENDLALAYHMGYDDALAKRKPDASKAQVLAPYDLKAENAKLREYATKLEQANIVLSSDNCDLKNDMRDMQFFIAENAKLREYAKLMYGHIKECCDACGERDICDVDALTRSLSDAMQLLYIDMYGDPLGAE